MVLNRTKSLEACELRSQQPNQPFSCGPRWFVCFVMMSEMQSVCVGACVCSGHVNSANGAGGTCTNIDHATLWCYIRQGTCQDEQQGNSGSGWWSETPCRSGVLSMHRALICD